MGLKLSNLNKPVGREAKILRDVNAIYMANREEFETTTVCKNGKVIYLVGKPPPPAERKEIPEWVLNKWDADLKAMEWGHDLQKRG